MKYKAIIFDLDGTVIDTEHIWRDVTHKFIEKRGIKITPELSDKLHTMMAGVGLMRGCTFLKELIKLEETIEQIAHEKTTMVIARLKTHLRFMEGFVDFHKKLKHHNITIGMATNADEHTLRLAEEHLKLSDYFGEHIYHVAHVDGKYKPDPAVYLHAAQKLGVMPRDCVAIEDSAHGVRAAVAAGMYCIGFNSSKKIELVKEAHQIVHSYHEIELEKLIAIPLMQAR